MPYTYQSIPDGSPSPIGRATSPRALANGNPTHSPTRDRKAYLGHPSSSRELISTTLRFAQFLFFLTSLILEVKADQFGVFTYEDTGSTITITRVEVTATGPIAVPPQIAGKPVTTIALGAFSDCENITTVSIPASATNIDWISFRKCASLAEFKVDGANPNFLEIDGIVFDPTQTILIAFPSGRGSV